MMTFIIYVVIIVLIFRYTKKKREGSSGSKASASDTVRQSSPSASAMTKAPKQPKPKKQKASARPNQERKTKQTVQEKQYSARTQVSSDNCSYEAAYSKGQPARLGLRGDYGEEVRQGQICVRCGYCGAENLVPSGSREHYHCYFCWEKL
ncbi:MAG: hypothetical protein LIO67_06865 [Lachnospiraceae bacterium]|nr:hypothetical protein [Lachnospiraceae bacterium]